MHRRLMHESDLVPGRAAHRLYVHVVWPTLGSIPLITAEARDALERHLIVLSRRLDAQPLCVRVLSERAHILLRFKPGHSVSELVSRLKGSSEAALNLEGHSVRWGRGYAAISIGGDDVRRVMRRIVRLTDPAPVSVPRSASAPRRFGRRKGTARPLPAVDAPEPSG